jgi:hypothetical protein
VATQGDLEVDGWHPTTAERPLYCHFLSGELRLVVDSASLIRAASNALKVLALGTSVPLYCPYSALWETAALNAAGIQFVRLLVSSRILDTMGYTDTRDEFLESRRNLYSYDRIRYPNYFDASTLAVLRSLPMTTRKRTATTAALIRTLNTWNVEDSLTPWTRHPSGLHLDRMLAPIVRRALSEREDQALTFAYFKTYLDEVGAGRQAEQRLRDRIYTTYTEHYMEHDWADIASGVFRVDFYDSDLAQGFPLHDVQLLGWLLNSYGFNRLLRDSWHRHRELWEALGHYRGWGAQQRMTSAFRQLIWTAHEMVRPDVEFAPPTVVRSAIKTYLRRFVPHVVPSTQDGGLVTLFEEASLGCERSLARLASDSAMSLSLEFAIDESAYAADVVLMTATNVETAAVLEVFSPLPARDRAEPRRVHVGDYTFIDLGQVAGAKVVLVQCEAGSGGPSGSQLVAVDSIRIWAPNAVILVGIAFGVDKRRQAAGDILVSKQIVDYELSRVGTSATGEVDVIIRGDRPPAAGRLLSRARSAVLSWEGASTSFGFSALRGQIDRQC